MQLTIRQKIYAGYMVMIGFTLIVGMYAVVNLKELNDITTSIIFRYGATAEKLTKLNDSILAQDLYEKRFLLLRQADAEQMFWSRSKDFRALLTEIGKEEASVKETVEVLFAAHAQFDDLFAREVSLLKENKADEANAISANALKTSFTRMHSLLREIDGRLKEQQREKIGLSNTLSERALIITAVLSGAAILFGILFASLITRHLSQAIMRLKEATNIISSGEFDKLPEIAGADELADLAVSFKEMSSRLKELEETNLDANPLTKLPGNLAIEKELLTRLNETTRFSFCLVDLDNFKAYNDRYSYARGSELIKWLADLLIRIRMEYGAEEDFLGHIGGDDFVIICDPARVQTICSKIIEEFDRGIIEHYDPEDAKKGFIISIDRNDKPAMFGIMTVSIAVVNTDRTLIRDPREVTQKVAELKQYAKTFAKSIYIMDRRRIR